MTLQGNHLDPAAVQLGLVQEDDEFRTLALKDVGAAAKKDTLVPTVLSSSLSKRRMEEQIPKDDVGAYEKFLKDKPTKVNVVTAKDDEDDELEETVRIWPVMRMPEPVAT